MSEPLRLVVVGGSDAGISAGLRAAELEPATEVTLVVADDFPNFSICGIPFWLSGEVADWRSLAHRTRQQLEAGGIRLRPNTTAQRIDVERHELLVDGAQGAERIAYDRLIVGTGATPARPPIPGLKLPGVQLLHSMGDAMAVQERLTDGARSAVIIGAGYIGVEMADALTLRGLEVTLIEQASTALTTVDPQLGSLVADELTRRGVRCRFGVTVQRIERREDRLAVHGSDETRVEADLVLVHAGVQPDTALAEGAGVPLGVRGALAVDRRMQTGRPDVWAAGDCTETYHRLLDHNVYLPLGSTAHKQGRVAGENAVGGSAEFAGTLGTQVVKVFDLAVAATGLREATAAAEGFDPLTVQTVTDDHKAYYPGAHRLHLRVVGDRVTGQLLGAQIAGHVSAQVAKRIDTFATAIYHRMSVAELSALDLSYTPPLSAPWDPVQTAAQAWERTRRLERRATLTTTAA
jgi:NADPH-dependent 2,4-dienoyl-CoA reductase/sulfur reductase-like enzyme